MLPISPYCLALSRILVLMRSIVMSNSLLALLNSRDALSKMHSGQMVSVHLSKLAGVANHSVSLPVGDTQTPHIHGDVFKGQVRHRR